MPREIVHNWLAAFTVETSEFIVILEPHLVELFKISWSSHSTLASLKHKAWRRIIGVAKHIDKSFVHSFLKEPGLIVVVLERGQLKYVESVLKVFFTVFFLLR